MLCTCILLLTFWLYACSDSREWSDLKRDCVNNTVLATNKHFILSSTRIIRDAASEAEGSQNENNNAVFYSNSGTNCYGNTFTTDDIDCHWFIYNNTRCTVAVNVTASVSGENVSSAMATGRLHLMSVLLSSTILLNFGWCLPSPCACDRWSIFPVISSHLCWWIFCRRHHGANSPKCLQQEATRHEIKCAWLWRT